jgi:hypothetical protein
MTTAAVKKCNFSDLFPHRNALIRVARRTPHRVVPARRTRLTCAARNNSPANRPSPTRLVKLLAYRGDALTTSPFPLGDDLVEDNLCLSSRKRSAAIPTRSGCRVGPGPHPTRCARGTRPQDSAGADQLDGARIDPDGADGPATAAAVLACKQKRTIVNPR